jgi:hypothetical protein
MRILQASHISNYTPPIGYGGIRLLLLQIKGFLCLILGMWRRHLGEKPFLAPYKAYLDRVRGVLYVLKRLPWMLRL